MIRAEPGTGWPLESTLARFALDLLLSSQNADGGWPFRVGCASWTEPTALASLALCHFEQAEGAYIRGVRWLTQMRGSDGGWRPAAPVTESTWVTSLMLVLLAERGLLGAHDPAVTWLLRQSGREISIVHRLRRWMRGGHSEFGEDPAAWPWTPATAGWVIPTASAILALEKVQQRSPDARIAKRVAEGRRFLAVHQCRDGGWNHGDSKQGNLYGPSFPETTGMALLALAGAGTPVPQRSIERAQVYARTCRSTQGACWIRLGLLANHAAPLAAGHSFGCRGPMDAALLLITRTAQEGRNVFLA